MRIYIESTIPSYYVARPPRNVIQAARQRLTIDWWTTKRKDHELFSSQLALDEIAVGEPEMASLRLASMQSIPLLPSTDEALHLAQDILESGLLPATEDRDATHIALATVHELDILLTWNYRHIANASIQARLRRLVDKAGFILPVICTPEEMR